MEKRSEILAILTPIQDTSYADVQSPDKLLEYAFQLTGWIAFSAEACAEAKEQLHNARRQAYLNVDASLNAQQKKYSASLVKDYINDCCAKENGYFTLCDRCNAATHANDLVRSAISYLKTELNNMQYLGR